MPKGVYISNDELDALHSCAWHASKPHVTDKKKCWCHLTTGQNRYGLHTGDCQTLRKHFSIPMEDKDGISD